MRRGSNDMQVMNVARLRRNLRNIAHNYSDAQRKVREATSNDPWGPSSTLMAEIADLTYNVVAFSEIMQMVWKRLNDHGRYWRHVYKALVLLEYLIKTGSEKVGQQCKENIFAIKTLRDFQYMEEGKDQGQNVREKAKHLVNLLMDDEKLKNERAKALKAKERFAQNASAFGSDGGSDTPSSPRYPAFRGDWNGQDASRADDRGEPCDNGFETGVFAADLPREIEIARPQTAGEEELQLQLALAMSREEAEQEEQKRKSDDVRLQLALSQSQQDFKDKTVTQPSHLVDLLDMNVAPADPWGMPQPPRPQPSSPWQASSLSSPTNGAAMAADPWQPKADPWGAPLSPSAPLSNGGPARHDPWSPTSPASSSDLDDFDAITNRNRAAAAASPLDQLLGGDLGGRTNGNAAAGDPFELNLMDALTVSSGPSPSTGATKKTPQSFLGENSALVNLDNLVTSKPANPPLLANPFSEVTAPPPKPTINEMKQQQQFGGLQPGAGFGAANGSAAQFGAPLVPLQPQVQDPWAPVQATNTASPWMKSGGEQANPFLS